MFGPAVTSRQGAPSLLLEKLIKTRVRLTVLHSPSAGLPDDLQNTRYLNPSNELSTYVETLRAEGRQTVDVDREKRNIGKEIPIAFDRAAAGVRPH